MMGDNGSAAASASQATTRETTGEHDGRQGLAIIRETGGDYGGRHGRAIPRTPGGTIRFPGYKEANKRRS